MKPSPLRLEPVDGYITISAAPTPAANIHEADSTYCRFYLTPLAGTAAWVTWSNLASWLPATDAPLPVHFEQLAASIGTTPARLTRTIQRITAFHLAYVLPTEPDHLHVQRRAATLSPKLVERLAQTCPTLAAAHDHMARTSAAA